MFYYDLKGKFPSIEGCINSQVSIVSQEPVLFNCSIEENIAYGLDGSASIDAIENAAVSNCMCYYSITIFTSGTTR